MTFDGEQVPVNEIARAIGVLGARPSHYDNAGVLDRRSSVWFEPTRPLHPNQIPGCRLRTGRIATASPPARLPPSRLGTATRLETTTKRANRDTPIPTNNGPYSVTRGQAESLGQDYRKCYKSLKSECLAQLS